MELLSLLNDKLTWHDGKRWDNAIQLMGWVFNHDNELARVIENANAIKKKIAKLDNFIQKNTSEVCPQCENVCCINKHGYYDYQDLIYIFAIGLEDPVYKEGLQDTNPCQFLTEDGCVIERSKRPFRCNWYFCNPLLEHMGNGPAKPYRNFIHLFQGIMVLRKEMVEEFFQIVNPKNADGIAMRRRKSATGKT